MFNGAHTRAYGALDGLRDIGVGKRVGPSRFRLFHRSPDFLFRVLNHVDRVGGRGDAATGHDLDLLRSGLELLACRPSDGVHAIGDVTKGRSSNRAGAELRVSADRLKIAMTAGLTEHAPGTKDSRPPDQAALDGDGDARIEAPCIADGRKAATQHAFQDELGLDCDPGRLPMYH